MAETVGQKNLHINARKPKRKNIGIMKLHHAKEIKHIGGRIRLRLG
jgi:hypothetical protein